MDCSPPGSSVRGILQTRILEWAATSFSRGSSRPRNRTHVSCIGRQILYHWATWEALIEWHFHNYELWRTACCLFLTFSSWTEPSGCNNDLSFPSCGWPLLLVGNMDLALSFSALVEALPRENMMHLSFSRLHVWSWGSPSWPNSA